jgi:hypothetical protein
LTSEEYDLNENIEETSAGNEEINTEEISDLDESVGSD